MVSTNSIFILGNPGSANDLVAKTLSQSPSVHHYKGAECELSKRTSASAKLFMDDLPQDGTISIETAMGALKQTQSNFYCGAGFKLEPEWTNNLFYRSGEHLTPYNGIRKLVSGNYGVNTYRNHKHTDIWPDHYNRWQESIDGVHEIFRTALDHEGNTFDGERCHVFAEYGNFHWFRQAFPKAQFAMPIWRNQMHFAFHYHLRQFGNAQDTDKLSNRDNDNANPINKGFAQELIARFQQVTDTKMEPALLQGILFRYPHYVPQWLMIHHQTNVDELLRNPLELERLVNIGLRRTMFFSMRKENMMRNDADSGALHIINDDFFVDEAYRQSIFAHYNLEYAPCEKFMQSIQSVFLNHKPKRADLPQEWKDMHTKPTNNQQLLNTCIGLFAEYCDHAIEVEPATALDDIKLHAPGKKQHWTRADELAIELTLVLRGVFDDIKYTNVGAWGEVYTVSEFVHKLEAHLENIS